MPIRELQCPGCKRNVRFRMNDKDHIVSSCSYCGWKPGGRHSVANRYVMMDDTKVKDTKLGKRTT